MSSLSINSATQPLYPFSTQSAIDSDSSSTSSAASAASALVAPTDSTQTNTQTAATQPAAEPSAGTHHHHRHGGGQFFKQIEQAVTSALQGVQGSSTSDSTQDSSSDSTSDTTDPNQVIVNAIQQVLQGLEGNGSAASPASGSSTTGGSTPTSATASAAANDPDSQQQTFAQLLQSYGVDPAQFRNDFLTAIQSAQNGQANPSLAFQSFPPGTMVDQVA